MKHCQTAGRVARAASPRALGSVRHLAPAEDAQTFAREGLVHDRLAGRPGLGLQRHEHHGRPVAAGLRQREPERAARVLEEAVRDLHEDAGSVAGARVGAGGATMQQVVEHLDAALHDGVRGFAAYVTDETDPARVLLVAGIVEALRRGQSPRDISAADVLYAIHESSATPGADRSPDHRIRLIRVWRSIPAGYPSASIHLA